MKAPDLPGTPLPENFIFLFQKIGLDNQDLRENSRYYIDHNGNLFYSANTDAKSGNQKYWNTPFPEIPTRKLEPSTLEELNTLISESEFASLKPYYPDKGKDEQSHSTAQCYTVRTGDEIHSVIVENDMMPEKLEAFRLKLNKIISASPLLNKE